MSDDNPIIGHKIHSDGKGGFYHTPLRKDEAEDLRQRYEDARLKRERDMPDEKSAINIKTLKNLYLYESMSGDVLIRLDWSNDRHHAVVIQPPFDREKVIEALLNTITLIKDDPNLGNKETDHDR